MNYSILLLYHYVNNYKKTFENVEKSKNNVRNAGFVLHSSTFFDIFQDNYSTNKWRYLMEQLFASSQILLYFISILYILLNKEFSRVQKIIYYDVLFESNGEYFTYIHDFYIITYNIYL